MPKYKVTCNCKISCTLNAWSAAVAEDEAGYSLGCLDDLANKVGLSVDRDYDDYVTVEIPEEPKPEFPEMNPIYNKLMAIGQALRIMLLDEYGISTSGSRDHYEYVIIKDGRYMARVEFIPYASTGCDVGWKVTLFRQDDGIRDKVWEMLSRRFPYVKILRSEP